ncbi:hypothetical protein PCASD_23261 [Puccinia coronata f. sp. avenae]|uniref:Uncharacterized protein n=1 Tax=Puccinia coronata f. sp. avenae TaxID=200324 RepID=A0A2N5S4L9_9BASI|nr:hypothetical protein PCASD_23261 [Puccinia coronata f. sp. avenae]
MQNDSELVLAQPKHLTNSSSHHHFCLQSSSDLQSNKSNSSLMTSYPLSVKLRSSV